MTVDLIVVGSGDAARSVAYPSREAGWSVTVVDSDPFGGTCDLRGCDAKKVLVGVSEVVDWTRRMMGKGVSSPVPTLVWPDMIRFKHTFVDAVPASVEQSFTKAGIRAVQGRAHFVGPTSLQVGDETLGIVGTALLVTWLSRGRLRPTVGWGAVAGAGASAGVGFTVSLLVATLAFDGAQLEEGKAGVLAAAAGASAVSWLGVPRHRRRGGESGGRSVAGVGETGSVSRSRVAVGLDLKARRCAASSVARFDSLHRGLGRAPRMRLVKGAKSRTCPDPLTRRRLARTAIAVPSLRAPRPDECHRWEVTE